MDLELFNSWEDVWRRTVLLYAYTVALLRVAGKCTTMTMTAFDFVSTVAMASLHVTSDQPRGRCCRPPRRTWLDHLVEPSG